MRTMAFNNDGTMVPPSDAAGEPAENFDRVDAAKLRRRLVVHDTRAAADAGTGRRGNRRPVSSLGGLVELCAEADESVHGGIDAAYQHQYRRHRPRHVDPMVAPPARAATIKLVLRGRHTTSQQHDQEGSQG
jgi:hypothetical protein